jgi:RNA polymerase sigma-70 factor (ECF subfamily)
VPARPNQREELVATIRLFACTRRVTPRIAPVAEIEIEGDDAATVRRVLAGDTEAFRALVERYEAKILRLVRSLAPRSSAHEDIAQDVFLSAFAALRSFDLARGEFAGWLFTIARNRCINAQKKMSPVFVRELPAVVLATTPADELAYEETRRRLDAAFLALPEDQRTAFVLEEVVGLSSEEVAEIEGVTAAAIRSRLSRAKARLRAALKSARGEDA